MNRIRSIVLIGILDIAVCAATVALASATNLQGAKMNEVANAAAGAHVSFCGLEYLTILPSKPGVVVHVHDIFTPLDYPEYVRGDHVLLWNEQYLLEAFLTSNLAFSVIGALNYLQKHYPDELSAACISQRNWPWCVPGSFWMQKVAQLARRAVARPPIIRLHLTSVLNGAVDRT